MSNINEVLEEQIGDLGVAEETTVESTTGLGKAKYFERGSTGTISREDSMLPITKGKIQLDREELGERSQFYPSDWEFWIKPASVQNIKSWSSIDDTKLDNIQKALNEILKSCLTIKCSNGNIPWSRINSWDRLWFLMKIREYTFNKGENSIEFDEDCSYCDNKLHYVLSADALVFDAPDMTEIGRHWNADTMTWTINPKEYDVQGSPTVTLYNPNLEKEEIILNYFIAKAQQGKDIDESFVKFLPWMLPRVSRDARVVERLIVEAEGKYKSWNMDMFNFMNEVLENIVIKPSENLIAICSKCGEEVESNIRFPDGQGLKSIFNVQSKHKKFGSK